MISFLVLTISTFLTFHSPANAATLSIVPAESTPDCEALGYFGPFELRRFSDPRSTNGRILYFLDSKQDLTVLKHSNNPNVYGSEVICQQGCDVRLKTVLDLNAMTFFYKKVSRSQGIDALCKGQVVKAVPPGFDHR